MRHEDEIKRGIEYFKGIIESGKVLRLGEPQILGQFNFWYHFVVTAYSKKWDFALSRDELSDIPGTRRYQQSGLAFAHDLEKRFKNVSPSLFFCSSGRLIQIDVEWPHRPWSGRTASYVTVRVVDILTNEFAYCFVAQTHQQDMFELKEDPFREYPGIANSIRKAVDSGSVTFYPSPADHPNDLQQVNLTLGPTRPPATDVSSFLKQKVLSMGFRSGGRDTEVWIADPWDAEYLGVPDQSLQMEAEFLEAEEFFRLNEDRDFGSAAKKLLLEERARAAANNRAPQATQRQVAHPPSEGAPTVFISYSWDSDAHRGWVIQLATRLRHDGINVVLDYWDLLPGGDRTKFMEKSIVNSEFVLIVCTPEYVKKANERTGGAGYETMIITSQLAKQIDQMKFIPVLRVGDFDDSAVPIWLQTKIGIDLRGDSYDELSYEDLVRTLHRENIKAPPVGPKPVFSDKKYLRDTGLVNNAVSAVLEPASAEGESRNESTSPKPPPVAYSIYQTKGPEAHQVDVYVRPLDAKGERFRMEPSNGERAEGTLAEIAQRYLLFDHDLRRKGYSRMTTFNGSGGQNFNLP